MASKKFYSDDDIQLAKAALSELPDLTAQRKTLRDFLDAIRDDIIVLVRTKGYTLADVRDTLKNAGYEVGEKALRDIIREAESKKPSRRSSSKTAPKKTDSGRKDGIDMNNCVFRSIRSRIGIEVRSAIRIHSINRELNFFYRFLTRFFAAFHYRGIFPQ